MSDGRALYKEGFLLFAEGDSNAAIAKYREALEVDPNLAIAWNALSLALRKLGDLDGALDAAQRLIALEPEDALSQTNLSILYQMKGMIPEAEEAKAQAMQLEMKANRTS